MTVLHNVQLDALRAGERDPASLSLADHHHVIQSGGELVTELVNEVHNLEGACMTFAMLDHPDASDVISSNKHTQVSVLKLNMVRRSGGLDINLLSLEVELDGIVSANLRVRKTHSATVMSHAVRESFLSLGYGLDAEQLVLGLLRRDLVQGEAALGVVQEAEVLLGLLDGDHIHESGGVRVVGTDFVVHLNETLNKNGLGLLKVQGVLQTITKESS